MSAFRAYIARGGDNERVFDYTPDGTATFAAGDLVYYDTSTNTMKICGADPALIAGLSEVVSSSSNLIPTAKVPIQLLKPSTVLAMSSATDYADSYQGDTMDISNTSSGLWKVLPGSTAAVRVICIGGVAAADSLDGAIFYVQFIAANLQFDAIAS